MDGSGKSTQIETLCCQLVDAGIPVMRLAFWDNVVGLSKWRAAFSHKFLKSDGRVGEPGKPACGMTRIIGLGTWSWHGPLCIFWMLLIFGV